MRRTVPLVLAAALLSAACDPNGDIRGFAPAPGTVDKLEVGSQSREDVVRLVDHLSLDRPVINGWSLGGAVATAAVAKLGERASGLVLTGGA